VALSVRDFGAGIPAEALGQVFEPFFTTGRSRGGTGLGLAIVHNLVTVALGGTIRIDSEVGGGTAVILTFRDMAPPPDADPSAAPMG
jgi:signal transduction histidine kinase